LFDSDHRKSIIDILHKNEADDLAKRMGVSVNDGVYHSLKMTKIRWGSKKAIALCDFFSVPHPEKKVVAEQPDIEFIPAKYPLFKHQRVAAKQIKHYLSTPNKRVVLHMPTGSGKTRTAMNVICDHLRETEPSLVIWLAHSQELCEQASEEFIKAWSILGNRDLSVYRYWGNHDINVDEISDGFVVAGLSKTFEALKKQIRFITELGRKTSLVIMDEAHSAIAETYSLLLDSLVIQKRTTGLIGLTATPGRTWLDMDVDEQLSKFFFKQKVSLSIEGFNSPIDYLVKEGYLASANFISFQYSSSEHFTESEIKSIQKSLDIPASILTKLAEDEQRNSKAA
jgi:superfamily II DNA or RNA helicase